MTLGNESFKRIIGYVFIVVLTSLAVWPFYNWIIKGQTPQVIRMEPGLDGSPDKIKLVYNDDLIYPELLVYKNSFKETEGSGWFQFRGPNRSGILSDSKGLLSGKDSEPEFLWSVELGEGHAAPVVSEGRVFVLDYDEVKSADVLRCFSLSNGEEMWSLAYSNPIKRNHGRSRSIPAISNNAVVTVGPSGDVLAARVDTGEFLWGFSMVKRYGGDVPLWYAAQCPLILNDVVYLIPGGKTRLAAYNLFTGEILWEIPNVRNWEMSHASLMTGEIDGKVQIIQSMIGGLAGFNTDGMELWIFPWNPAVIAPSPLFMDGNRIFQSAGYGVGGLILEISLIENIWSAEVIREYLPGEGISTEQQTAVYYKDRLWAVLPKDAGGFREQLVCASTDGEILWTSGQEYRFGLGPWIIADDKLFVLSDDGILTAAETDLSKWSPIWSYKVLDGNDAWGPPAISDGLILVRDSMSMSCFDIKE